MKLISWNVARRKGKANAQCEYLASFNPDIVALQEVTPSTIDLLSEGLSAFGLENSVCSISAHVDNTMSENRSYGVLIASRFPVKETKQATTPWREKTLSTAVQVDDQWIDVHTAYIPPGSSNGWVKIETIEGIVVRVLQPSQNSKILCGDFNCPQLELEDGTIITWGQKVHKDGSVRIPKRWRGDDGSRWDNAERSLFTILADNGISDVYRLLNGYSGNGFSWAMKRKGNEFLRRYDHVFASRELKPILCDYLHEPRLNGLSDHAAILVEFDTPSY